MSIIYVWGMFVSTGDESIFMGGGPLFIGEIIKTGKQIINQQPSPKTL